MRQLRRIAFSFASILLLSGISAEGLRKFYYTGTSCKIAFEWIDRSPYPATITMNVTPYEGLDIGDYSRGLDEYFNYLTQSKYSLKNVDRLMFPLSCFSDVSKRVDGLALSRLRQHPNLTFNKEQFGTLLDDPTIYPEFREVLKKHHLSWDHAFVERLLSEKRVLSDENTTHVVNFPTCWSFDLVIKPTGGSTSATENGKKRPS